MKLRIILPCLALGLLQWSWAGAQEITGNVYESGDQGSRNPLPGVNVYWLSKNTGTATDAEGNFRLSAAGIKDLRLVFSFIGYRTDTIPVRGLKTVEVQLFPEKKLLNTVEVQGDVGNAYISSIDPHKVQVVTSKELKRAACCNLSESFETNSSVDVMYADAITGARQIQMLGLSGVYSQIISENVPLLRGLGSTFGLSYIPGPWMESISVAKGAGSVKNGFESTTGLINVEYKKPATSEKLFLNAYINQHGRLEANVNTAVRINDKLSTMVMGHASTFNKPFDNNGDGFMDIPKLTTYNFINRWDYHLPGKFDSRFLVKYMDESRTGGLMSFNQATYSPEIDRINNQTETYGFHVGTRRLESFWKNGLIFNDNSSLALIVSGIYHSQSGFFGFNKYDGKQKSLYGQLLYDRDLSKDGKHHLATGLSYMHDNYSESYFRRDFTYLYQALGVMDVTDPKDTLLTVYSFADTVYILNRMENVEGAYAEYTWNPSSKLTLIAGIRGDYHNTYGFFVTPRIHVRYKLTDHTTFRASAGKGYRTANLFAENYSIMASQRIIHLPVKADQEEAWNFGVNLTHDFKLFDRDAQIDLEAYRTFFLHQVITDLDSTPADVFFYNLSGKSFANSYMAQITLEPVKRFTVLAAFRMSDVKTTYNGELRKKPMVNAYKGILTLGYATKYEKWKFDVTWQFNGKARIPDTQKMPVFLQRPSSSPAYIQLLAQVTRKFKHLEAYVGGENLTNFTQKDPVTEAFAPYHTHFDTSMVWGPIVGATIYGGVRISVK